jgi:hypothetical protein
MADYFPLPKLGAPKGHKRARVRIQKSDSVKVTPHSNLLPSIGQGVKINISPKKTWDF